MKISQLLRTHPSMKHNAAIQTICSPLRALGIIYFSHAHIDAEGRLSCVAQNPDFFQLYINKGYFNFDLHMKQGQAQEQYILWDTVQRKNQSKHLHEDFMSFDQGHTFSIILNHGTTHDYYHFATPLNDGSANGRYLENLTTLKKFILHYHEKMMQHKELAAAYSLKIDLSENKGRFYTVEDDPKNKNILTKDEFNRIYLHSTQTYLTKREYECLHWLAQGKTMDQIAEILTITARTVKAHIGSLKEKSGCNNLFQLGRFYASMPPLY